MKKIIAIALIVVLAAIVPVAAQTAEQAAPAPDNQALLESAEAEQDAATTEAGKYERKSVTFIDALWLMDKSVRGMPGEYVGYTLEKIKEKLMMPRFDYNPLPQSFISDFVAQANAKEEITIDNIAEIMDKTIVPKILAIVDLNKELRAQNYTSEADRNSFYAIKAKEFGFSDVEIAKVMNSAFIFITVCKSYSGLTSGGQYKMLMDVGILWYRISTKGEKAQAKLVVKKMTKSMGFAKEGKTFMKDGKLVDHKEFAFRSCVKNAARNLLVATQEMPEFRLSGQVVEVDAGKVGFDLGKNEGLRADDKFRIAEFEESEDGSVKSTFNGWGVVSMVADSNSKEGYKSKAQIVAGEPMTGSVLSEFPRIPIDIAIKFRTFPGVANSGDTTILGMGMGLQLDARYNIGRHFGVNQLFAGVGYGLGSAGEADIATYSDGASVGQLDILLMKRFLVKRFTLGVEAGLASFSATASRGSIGAGAFSLSIDETFSGMGFFAGANAGFNLTPALIADLSIRFESATLASDWQTGDFPHSGIGIHAGLTWSPPSLPFDPVDMVRGRLGL
ncbi:MAG: hypothetical protein A2487_07710 [Candidatus Raymondbacteria bacterium RifOxyC12_full_50_8]|nr:MAG: hypothetical protein A2487_07710 [Candidatus Raymondbacteria bacterium RifOxyC12_full_50_8]